MRIEDERDEILNLAFLENLLPSIYLGNYHVQRRQRKTLAAARGGGAVKERRRARRKTGPRMEMRIEDERFNVTGVVLEISELSNCLESLCGGEKKGKERAAES